MGMAPYSKIALKIAVMTTGNIPTVATRFTTGSRHYVYEVAFAQTPPVVVRLGDGSAHAEMAGAVNLSQLLRPLGVPLPALLANDATAELPWMVLERLPGADLGANLVLTGSE